MKYRYKLFVHTLIPLVAVLNLFSTQQSQAKPSSIFQPIIQEIKARIPSDLKMRLPAFIPTSTPDTILYSFIFKGDRNLTINLDNLEMDFFTVQIANTPDCSSEKNPQDCIVAIAGVTEDPVKSEVQLNDLISDNEEDIDIFEFGEGIKGFYFVDGDLQLIIWRQDKMANLLMTKQCSDDCISQQDLIKMAKSAANEPAIISADTSYYSF